MLTCRNPVISFCLLIISVRLESIWLRTQLFILLCIRWCMCGCATSCYGIYTVYGSGCSSLTLSPAICFIMMIDQSNQVSAFVFEMRRVLISFIFSRCRCWTLSSYNVSLNSIKWFHLKSTQFCRCQNERKRRRRRRRKK